MSCSSDSLLRLKDFSLMVSKTGFHGVLACVLHIGFL
ncbi:hypothetical protein OIU84_001050 [Salix udensis]|uniref:Uncharacterized protein n=1 Tax=Salix udensis TaxID=889485 RepID=A0AAD6PMR9_9ROSI|nr:hypothetical protein OIU84_001050 [Salix udensis]